MKTYIFTVVVEAENEEQATEVMQERIYFEEDYGFPYEINYARNGVIVNS